MGAVYVRKPSPVETHLLNIRKLTVEKSLICARVVGKPFSVNMHLLSTRESTLEKRFMSVTNVENSLAPAPVLKYMGGFTVEPGLMCATNVEKPTSLKATLISTRKFTPNQGLGVKRMWKILWWKLQPYYTAATKHWSKVLCVQQGWKSLQKMLPPYVVREKFTSKKGLLSETVLVTIQLHLLISFSTRTCTLERGLKSWEYALSLLNIA